MTNSGNTRQGSVGEGGVALRPVVPADLPAFFAHQADPEAARMADFPSRDEAAFMAHWQRVFANETAINRTILLDGQVVGNIGSWSQDGERHVGYWLDRAVWGRGVATAALALLLREIVERPIHAEVARHNRASLRVLEKCGFVPCGEDAAVFMLRLD